MFIKNPLFNKTKETADGYILKEKDIERFSLYLSFLMLVPFVLSLYFYKEGMDITIPISITVLSLALSIIFFIFVVRKKRIIYSVLYSIFVGIFYGFFFSLLKELLSTITINGIEEYNKDAIVLITIGTSMVVPVVTYSIYYLFFNYIKNFNLIYLINVLFLILLSFFLNYLLSKNMMNYNFFMNFFSSITTILIESFILSLYFEAIRIKVSFPLEKDALNTLATLPLSVLIYGIIEIFSLIFLKDKQ